MLDGQGCSVVGRIPFQEGLGPTTGSVVGAGDKELVAVSSLQC